LAASEGSTGDQFGVEPLVIPLAIVENPFGPKVLPMCSE